MLSGSSPYETFLENSYFEILLGLEFDWMLTHRKVNIRPTQNSAVHNKMFVS